MEIKMRNDISYRPQAVCTAVTGSMTSAMTAQRALGKIALRAKVVKVGTGSTSKGCIYGVEFDCAAYGSVRSTLSTAGVDVKEYLR
jgi:hypothetical protein